MNKKNIISAVAFVLFYAVSVIGFSSISRYIDDVNTYSTKLTTNQREILIFISRIPRLVFESILEIKAAIQNEPIFFLEKKENVEKSNWVRHFPEAKDPGYILLSAIDKETKNSSVRLLRISDGTVIARWDPNWQEIYQKISARNTNNNGSRLKVHAHNALLTPDGDLVFHTGDQVGSLVKLSACTNQIMWVSDIPVHHSVERDADGNFWAPSFSQEPLTEYPLINGRIIDDSIAFISNNGKMIKNLSFAKILLQNDLQWLLFGTAGVGLHHDPLHLNQINIASEDSKFWVKGDLLISSRHLSTVFLYRPSTNKIIWFKTGPWMGQHDAAFINDHQISVFDNNAITFAPKNMAFLKSTDINRVIVYDFINDRISQPFKDLLTTSTPLTHTQGRSRILPDGGLFIEESNSGRHIRFTDKQLLWSRVNDYDEKHIGLVFWSRYLTATEASIPIKALSAKGCSGKD